MVPKILLSLAILSASTLYAADNKKDTIHMYPQPKEGSLRFVVEVPALENENNHKVELQIGKVMKVDCNQHILMGILETKPLKGWGYTYLEASNINGMRASTRMACSEPESEKFVTLAPSENSLRRYNSRSPIVVYVPKEYEVRYRLWSADEKSLEATQR